MSAEPHDPPPPSDDLEPDPSASTPAAASDETPTQGPAAASAGDPAAPGGDRRAAAPEPAGGLPRIRRSHWILLLLLFVAHAAVNGVWISRDRTMRGFDEPLHITAEAHAYNLVAAHGLVGVGQVLRGARAGQWPSAGYLPWVPLSLLFGHSIHHLQAFNLLYLALLLVSLLLLGRRLHSPEVGLFAGALVSVYPAIFGASRHFNHDLPYVAVVAMNVALLLGTERFRRPGRAALLGLGVGFAVLVRPHSLIFLAAPGLFWAVLSLVRPGELPRWRVLLHIALGGLCAAATAAVWWFQRVDTIQLILVEHVTGRVNLPWMTEPSALFYLAHLPSAASPLMLGLAGLALGVILWQRRGPRPGGGPLLSAELVLAGVWLLLGLGAISVFKVHLNRYQYPILPALALVTAVGLWAVPWRRVRTGVVGLALAGGATGWILCSFVEDPRPLPAALCPCDPSSSRARGERWESSGTPDTDNIIVAMDKVADELLKERGTGRGLLLHTYPHLRMALMMKPVLLTRLPLLQISHRPLDEYGRDQRNEECESLHQTLGGFSFNLPHLPWSRCFTLNVDFRYDGDAETPPDPVPDASRRFQTSTRWGGGIVRFTLWDHPTCPPRSPPHIDPRTGKEVIPCP